MCINSRQINKFRKSENGIAALEFALIVPIMIMIFLAIVELSDTLVADRKVNVAANMLSDLVSQEQYLTYDELDGIFYSVAEVMRPYGIDNAKMWVASIKIDANDKPIIQWSIDRDLNEKFVRGTVFNAISNKKLKLRGSTSIITQDQTVIVAYIEYDFIPSLSNALINKMTFQRHAARWPRRALSTLDGIIYCDKQNKCSDE